MDENQAQFDADDIEHAREREAYVLEIFKSLKHIASEGGSKLASVIDRTALEQAAQTISCNVSDLVGFLQRVEEPGERGDMFGLVADILEATFEIGRFGAASQGAFDLAKRSHQSAAAQGRVRKRQEEAKAWKDFCEKRANACRVSTPSMTTDDIAEKVRDELPIGKARPGLPTIAKHIRELEAGGKLPRKRKAV